LTCKGRFGAADKAIVINSLVIGMAMTAMTTLNHNTIPTNQLMQMQR